jgi:hypothetical protein
MLKYAIAAAVAGFFTISSAFAAEMLKCEEADMMKMQKEIDADVDPGMKKQVEMANAEMKMAGDAMHASKMDECAMHLNKAMEEFHKMN